MLAAFIDQLTKQLIRTTPSLQNLEIIPGWLVFAYTQNPGMALGNIIDRLIMAKIGGYGHILQGRVNDFLYFTYSFNGDPVFPYIFNMADVFISTSIILLLIFNRRILPESEHASPADQSSA